MDESARSRSPPRSHSIPRCCSSTSRWQASGARISSASPGSSSAWPKGGACSWSSIISRWSPISCTPTPCSPAARSSLKAPMRKCRRTPRCAKPISGPVMAEPLLAVRDLHAWYGESQALHGVEFTISAGEVVTLLGRNGAGKTTTLKAIMGVLGKRQGSVRFQGKELIHLPSNRIARLGLAYCPEERGIFASLNVEENLMLPPVVRPGGMSVEEIYTLFPNLLERRASPGTKLSGGEQQMLAIGRILRTGANLLLLDEPTEGLAPVIVQRSEEHTSELQSR